MKRGILISLFFHVLMIGAFVFLPVGSDGVQRFLEIEEIIRIDAPIVAGKPLENHARKKIRIREKTLPNFDHEGEGRSRKKLFAEEAQQAYVPSDTRELFSRWVVKYPRLSKRRGEQGRVELLVRIRNDNVNLVRVVRSSGHERLDEAARESLLMAKVRKGISENSLVDGRMIRLAVNFKLSDDS